MEIGIQDIADETGYGLAKVRKDVQRGKLCDLNGLVRYVLGSYLDRGLERFGEEVSGSVPDYSGCLDGKAVEGVALEGVDCERVDPLSVPGVAKGSAVFVGTGESDDEVVEENWRDRLCPRVSEREEMKILWLMKFRKIDLGAAILVIEKNREGWGEAPLGADALNAIT